jgi:tetratricopeptide (TPR) repeat protein
MSTDSMKAEVFVDRSSECSNWDNAKIDSAVAAYTEAIRLDPDSSAMHLACRIAHRAEAYTKKGDFDSAIADCNEVIRLDPNSGLGYLYLGGVYLARSQMYRNKGDQDAYVADRKEMERIFRMGEEIEIRNRG